MYNPGDVVLRDFTISGIGGSVDIRRRVKDFSVYENIKTPYTTIVATIIDTTDILNTNVVLDGVNNSLTASFSQPNQHIYDGQWQIIAIEKGRNLENQRAAEYKITGYSPHMTKFPKVQKSFKEVPATGVAASLINEYLSPLKGLVIGAPARSIVGNSMMPYNINGVQIHKAVRSVLTRAASTSDTSSAYVWFENQFNMVIDTLENLMNKAQGSQVATFYQRPMGQNFLLDVARQPFIILAMKEESRANAAESSLDNKNAINTLDLFSSAFSKGKTGGATSYMNLPYNILRPPTFLKSVLDARKTMAGKFDSQSATIQVSLQTDVTVGLGINIETLAPAGDTDEAVLDSISGPLLATEVRHTVQLNKQKMQGMSTIKGVKGNIDYLGLGD
jgi:hypothetical protein